MPPPCARSCATRHAAAIRFHRSSPASSPAFRFRCGKESKMFITKKTLPRRTFLRGMGVRWGGRMLDGVVRGLSGGEIRQIPRLGFIFVANVVFKTQGTPAAAGVSFALPPILKPLEPV